MNSCFPYRWPPANLTFNIYFYLFLYLYITRITINDGTPHLKPPKKPKQKSRLWTASNKITGGLQLVCGRPTLALSSALVPQTISCSVCCYTLALYWCPRPVVTISAIIYRRNSQNELFIRLFIRRDQITFLPIRQQLDTNCVAVSDTIITTNNMLLFSCKHIARQLIYNKFDFGLFDVSGIIWNHCWHSVLLITKKLHRKFWARLFKTNDVVSKRFVKILNVNIWNMPIFLL